MAPLYTTDILRLAASVAQWPPLDDAQGEAERRSPTCGSRVNVGVRVDGGGRVAAVGLTVNACALGQASSAVLAEQAAGLDSAAIAAARDTLRAYLSGTGDDLPDWRGMDHLSRARPHAARHASILLPFDALLGAIEAALAARTSAGERTHG